MTTKFKNSLLGLGVLAVSSCGIDQGGAPTINQPPSVAVVYGPITGFGSIIVNGETYDVSSALIMADGAIATESDLREGQVVRTIASVSASGSEALLVTYQENLRGVISAVDSVGGTFEVLGNTVLTNNSTRFDIGGAGALANGMRVEISGLDAPGGQLQATYVGAPLATDPLEATFTIDSVDVANQTFTLGPLVVDYSQTNLLEVPGGIPSVGVVVEVEASQFLNGVLIAEVVRSLESTPGSFSIDDTDDSSPSFGAAGAPSVASALDSNFVGFVEAANLPDAVQVAGIRVDLAGATIVGGIVNDLQVGRLVRIEGQVSMVGVIAAQEITLF